MKENADLFLDVFCPLLSLDDELCSMFRLPNLSMLLLGGPDGGVGVAAASSCPTASTATYSAIISQHLHGAASSSHSSSVSSSPDPSADCELSCGPIAAFFSCFSSGGCSHVAMVLFTVLGMYLLVATLVNLVACYNFVVAWNLIARMYHVDLTFVSGPRSSSTSSSSRSSVGTDSMPSSHRGAWRTGARSTDRGDALICASAMKDTCCPVCLEEFYELEKVASCEDGCGAWYHRACLAEWLDRSDSCPCCRRDMAAAPRYQSRGCWHDLTVFLGYAPAR